MRILLDTNILLNWLIETNSKHAEAKQLVQSCLFDDITVKDMSPRIPSQMFSIFCANITTRQKYVENSF